VFFDVCPRGGALLTAAEALQRYPNLGAVFGTCGAATGGSSDSSSSSSSSSRSSGSCIVGVWAEMARTMVMAHQRRGESDLVAHWIYQLMALDTRAPEWQHALAG